MEEGIGEEKKSMSAIVIVLIVIGILVGLAVVGTVIFAGIVFLWASDISETDGGSVDNLFVRGEIDADADTLTFEMISGTRDWNDLLVTVDGMELTTSTGEASAGDEVVFSSPSWDPIPDTTYMVNVKSISDNMNLWGSTITAK